MSDQAKLQPNVVPTSGPTVEAEGLIGQNPYTDPPPLARRRFYEDPRPIGQASEEQVLQGRGAPAYYPPDAPNPSREWNPRRYRDQAETPRPADSPQPSDPRAAQMTVEQLARLPEDEQEDILAAARETAGVGAPEFRPTKETLDAEDEAAKQGETLRQQQTQQALAQRGGGVPQMGPATPGTLTSGRAGEPSEDDGTAEQQNIRG